MLLHHICLHRFTMVYLWHCESDFADCNLCWALPCSHSEEIQHHCEFCPILVAYMNWCMKSCYLFVTLTHEVATHVANINSCPFHLFRNFE